MLFNLLSTTDRSGILGFILGFVWWALFWEKWQLKSKRKLYITIVIITIIILVSCFVLIMYFEEIISARPGSLITRQIIYKYSFKSWLERPFFGWGVARNISDVFPNVEVPENFPPLGTHSTYLEILYKQGILGLMAISWFLISLAIYISRCFRRIKISGNNVLYRFIGFAAWGFMANLIQESFNMLDLDSVSFHITWINISLMTAACLLAHKESAVKQENDLKNEGINQNK